MSITYVLNTKMRVFIDSIEQLAKIVRKEETVYLLVEDIEIVHKIMYETDAVEIHGPEHVCIHSYDKNKYPIHHSDHQLDEMDEYEKAIIGTEYLTEREALQWFDW